MTVAETLEDIITEQAPIVCEQIEAAVSFASKNKLKLFGIGRRTCRYSISP
jgi:hypothetical protein